MKYTLEQLQELASQNKLAELDEICALACGWTIYEDDTYGQDVMFWRNESGEIVHPKNNYRPSTNKSQCFDLLEKLPLDIGRDSHDFKTIGFINCVRPIRCTGEINLRVAVTIAAILVAQEGDK